MGWDTAGGSFIPCRSPIPSQLRRCPCRTSGATWPVCFLFRALLPAQRQGLCTLWRCAAVVLWGRSCFTACCTSEAGGWVPTLVISDNGPALCVPNAGLSQVSMTDFGRRHFDIVNELPLSLVLCALQVSPEVQRLGPWRPDYSKREIVQGYPLRCHGVGKRKRLVRHSVVWKRGRAEGAKEMRRAGR